MLFLTTQTSSVRPRSIFKTTLTKPPTAHLMSTSQAQTMEVQKAARRTTLRESDSSIIRTTPHRRRMKATTMDKVSHTPQTVLRVSRSHHLACSNVAAPPTTMLSRTEGALTNCKFKIKIQVQARPLKFPH